jgi:hypothetical protein
MYLLDDGKCLRQPVLDHDVALGVHNMLLLEESKGQTYELGGSQVYTMKELMEFFSNTMSHRPRFISMEYEEFMAICLSPNPLFEKAIHWLLMRPDISSELRTNIIVKKRDGIKTFEDLYITPVATHHVLYDLGNWMMDRLAVERKSQRDLDEEDANDDGNP